jgi:hypothetical protein
MRAVIGACSF